jgi:4-hydroxy-3-methylbut-2-enyl diphosphate reductase
MSSQLKKILLINPRGFCAGVVRAIKTVDEALALYGRPVFVRHHIVHNERVVKDLEIKGAIFVESLNEVPRGAVVIFSAHGVSSLVKKRAEESGLKFIDAACPLVIKIHVEAIKYNQEGYAVLFIGRQGHQEAIGLVEEMPAIIFIEKLDDIKNLKLNTDKIVCLTQTTLSIDETEDLLKELKNKFPQMVIPGQSDICNATYNRQRALKSIASQTDLILVIGSKNSNNTNSLVKVAEQNGVKVYLISDQAEINPDMFDKVQTVGITSGASTPEVVVNDVVEKIKSFFPKVKIEEVGEKEKEIVFVLPKIN